MKLAEMLHLEKNIVKQVPFLKITLLTFSQDKQGHSEIEIAENKIIIRLQIL